MRLFNFVPTKPSRGLLLAVVGVASTLAVGLIFSSVLNFKSAGGSLTAYLIGSVDGRDNECWGVACGNYSESSTTETVIRLANPTNVTLRAFIAVYKGGFRGAKLMGCKERVLSKNSYAEVNLMSELNTGSFNIFNSLDLTVKVLTVDALQGKVQAGLKGWLTHFFAVTMDDGSKKILLARESQLQGVPIEVAKAGEAAQIISDCTT